MSRNLEKEQWRNFLLHLFPLFLLLSGQIFNFIKNREHFKLFVVPPNLFFYIGILAIILSFITVYRMSKFYFEIGSVDYLIISLFIMGMVLSINMNILWMVYLTPYASEFVHTKPDVYFDFYPQRPLLGDVAFIFGVLMLLIHSIRLIEWQNFNKIMKFVTLFVLYDRVITFIHHSVWAFQMSTNRLPGIDTLDYYVSMEPFNFLRFGSVVYNALGPTFTTFVILLIFASLPFIILLYSYSKIDPVLQNIETGVSKFVWISFAIITIVGRWISDLLFNLLQNQELTVQFFQVWTLTSFSTSFSMILLIMLLLIFYPESLLLSKYQLNHAKKLYKFVSHEGKKPMGFEALINYKARVSNYLNNFPTDIKEEIELGYQTVKD